MSSKRKQNGSKDWMFEKTIKKPQNRSYEKKNKKQQKDNEHKMKDRKSLERTNKKKTE